MTVQQQDDPIIAAVKLMREHGVPLPEIEAYVAKKRGHDFDPSTTSHTGKPFVNAMPDTGETIGDRAAGAISSVYNGMTFGQGDKVIAALRTAASKHVGTDPVLTAIKMASRAPTGYSDALKDQSAVSDQHERNHFVESTGENALGGLATLIGTGVVGAAGKAAKSAPALMEHIPVVGRVIRAAKAVERIGQRIAPEATTAAPEAAPMVEGYVGNGPPTTSALGEAAPSVAKPEKISDLMASQDARMSAPSKVVDALKKPRQSHRTQASFRDMAERMGAPPRPASLESMGLEGVENTPISGAPKSSALDTQLQEMWAKSKKLNPGEVGNTFGDAEEAMGLAEHQQPDLMALLRHSIIAKGGVPRVP